MLRPQARQAGSSTSRSNGFTASKIRLQFTHVSTTITRITYHWVSCLLHTSSSSIHTIISHPVGLPYETEPHDNPLSGEERMPPIPRDVDLQLSHHPHR